MFATAYSHLDIRLVARATPADLERSLDALWESVARYGTFKPVAIPLIGAGLARVVELDRDQLITMIIASFIRSSRRPPPPPSPELRVVVRPGDVGLIDLLTLERRTEELAPSGISRPGQAWP